MQEIRLFEIVPKPCIHDAAGAPHPDRRSILACLDENGVPGFDLRPNGV